jgi:hypothetical protein
MVTLLATYYVFDLHYPKMFSQVLGLFQRFLLNVPYEGAKTSGFKNFMTLLERKME